MKPVLIAVHSMKRNFQLQVELMQKCN
jgi:hypothetical protein